MKRVDTKADFLRELEHNSPHVMLSEEVPPSFDWFTALGIAREQVPDIPLIVVTKSLGKLIAIETFESGATIVRVRIPRLRKISGQTKSNRYEVSTHRRPRRGPARLEAYPRRSV